MPLPSSSIAPGQEQPIDSLEGGAEVVVVIVADGIIRAEQLARMGGAEGKEVDHIQRTIPPNLGKPHAAADGGIIAFCICRTGVEHDKSDRRGLRIPTPPEPIAIQPRGIKLCAPFNGEGRDRRAIDTCGHREVGDRGHSL